jgi:hypothetical protein
MKKPENPNKKLELVIKDSDLPSLSKEFADVAIDGVLSDGVLKDIPLVGGIVGLVKFSSSISKYLTAKKIYKFLFQLHNTSQQKRIRKIDQINISKKYQSSVGEMIFELLERIESDGKPEIIGKLFRAVIEGYIDYAKYLKATHIVKTVFYYDLLKLKQVYDGEYINQEIDETLRTNGLVQSNVDFVKDYKAKLDFDDNGSKKESADFEQEKDSLTEMGKLIVEIGME